ncbi:HTH-type transcriptional repressor FabR [Paraferrimonas sp. SM1919]|uniref:HTH-type transcriptional repressor FabR n=1 Tax=Paraferrimonas sp. SM1919 TaxID=2662263 RepID=UPI0013D6503A|nr:HTH-type transcriptional repressor FabR [Paraferrimonas sp. SM1919]
MGVRAEQKEKTRRALIDACFNQLSAEKSFSTLSLREVSREAGIAPTSFYRHFKDMDELGLTLVDEGGLLLRQLMRKGRQRAEAGGGIIQASIETFIEVLERYPNIFRILLHERSGTSAQFRSAVAREIEHFTLELAHDIEERGKFNFDFAYVQADAMVTLVFTYGAKVLDMKKPQRMDMVKNLVMQLRMVSFGADTLYKKTSAD